MVIMNIKEVERSQALTVYIYRSGGRIQMPRNATKHLDHEKLMLVDSSWNVMGRGDAGKGSEGETGEWSG